MDRRSFLKIAGGSIGVGALFHVMPLAGTGRRRERADDVARANGEAPAPFSFVQMSDTHVGFEGPPNPLGTAAFERAVDVVNGLAPDLVLFTGDLTHDSEKPGEHAARMKRFREIAGRLKAPTVRFVPGEHDAGIDGGALYREHFGETHFAFDHRGVHFIALDNVSSGRPAVGAAQLAWMKKDLGRFPKGAPIVVMTHRPLFDLAPEWEWFTSDGDEVLQALAPFDDVTVLYGHIHRADTRTVGKGRHLAARSLAFAFPDPATTPEKKPMAFSKEAPFANLGVRELRRGAGGLEPREISLTIAEHAGTAGIARLVKEGDFA